MVAQIRGEGNMTESVGKRYMEWVKRFPLRPIVTREENVKALAVLSELIKLSNRGEINGDEAGYLQVLATLIKEFEGKTYDLGPYLTQGEMLEELMKEHGLKQADLIPEMGTQSAVSHVVSGRRKLTAEQISALSKRFHVSPAIFFNCEEPVNVVAMAKRSVGAGVGRVKPKRKKRR